MHNKRNPPPVFCAFLPKMHKKTSISTNVRDGMPDGINTNVLRNFLVEMIAYRQSWHFARLHDKKGSDKALPLKVYFLPISPVALAISIRTVGTSDIPIPTR